MDQKLDGSKAPFAALGGQFFGEGGEAMVLMVKDALFGAS